jgi:transposase
LANGDIKCKDCFEKKIEIDRLKEKIVALQAALKYKVRSTQEKPFGESTPSSKELKKNSSKANREKPGGAKSGHVGHGRTTHDPEEVKVHLELDAVESCPNCEVRLREIDTRTRSIIDVHPIAAFKKLFSFGRFECPCCGDRFKSAVPALPKFRFGNRLLAQVAVMHYLHGIPLKKVCRMLGDEVNVSAFHSAFEKLSDLCAPAKALLVGDFRAAKVKHADETGWRTDGHSGYAWYFGSKDTSIFEFRNTRSGSIAREILGTEPLCGFLVVDRYNGYNRTRCKIQYCYAHLLRDVKSLRIEFPENEEIKRFANTFGELLSRAMKLKNLKISDKSFYARATKIRKKIEELAEASASHQGIRRIQDIFREKADRLYHWAEDRDVPAHNNFAEREIRPTAIARKASFGSQSEAGALRRSNLMSVLHSANKRIGKGKDICEWFEERLNEIVLGADPAILRVNPQ